MQRRHQQTPTNCISTWWMDDNGENDVHFRARTAPRQTNDEKLIEKKQVSLITLLFSRGENEPCKHHFVWRARCEKMKWVKNTKRNRKRICVDVSVMGHVPILFDFDGANCCRWRQRQRRQRRWWRWHTQTALIHVALCIYLYKTYKFKYWLFARSFALLFIQFSVWSARRTISFIQQFCRADAVILSRISRRLVSGHLRFVHFYLFRSHVTDDG